MPVDELSALPALRSMRRLMGRRVTRGRCELLPALSRRASAWHRDVVGPRAGDFKPDWWEPDPLVRCRAVHAFRLRDAYYVPSYGVVISSAGEAMECSLSEARYITPDLLALPHVVKSGEETFLDLREKSVSTLERAIVTLPWGGIGNYGHFVLDCLSGAVLLRETRALAGHAFVFPPLQDWQRRHLELIDVRAVELADTIYRVSDLLFPSCMSHFLHAPNLNALTLRKRQLRHVVTAAAPLSRKIYISRRGRGNRVARREAELEQRLSALGFRVVAPETCSIDEQLALFHHADVVVGSTGAAMANVLYCRRDTLVFEIRTPLLGGPWLASLCALVGCRWRPYFCGNVTPGELQTAGGVPRPEAAYSFDLDTEDFLRFLERSQCV